MSATNYLDIINRLLELLDFNPDQTSFSLRGFSMHLDMQRVIDFVNDVDHTGGVALVYLCDLCREYLEDLSVNVWEALENPSAMDVPAEIHRIVKSEPALEAARKLAEMVAMVESSAAGRRFIGDAGTEVAKSVRAVVEKYRRLGLSVYLKSGRPVGKIERIARDVKVFSSLAECLMALERSSDGMALCFIAADGTMDGYFGLFVKSNGNVFSVDDRLDEAYVGQHSRFRNGRIIDDAKAYELFPYDEMCRFAGEDYKGYATSMEIDRGRLDLFDQEKIPEQARTRLVILMAMVALKHEGRTLDGDEVMVDSMLVRNTRLLPENSEALVKVGSSAIALASEHIASSISFDAGRLVRGEYNAEFDNSNENRRHNEKGFFEGLNQEMVDAYADGFKLDDGMLLKSDSSKRLLGDGSASLEFVGIRGRIELRAYYEARKQLADHVAARMQEDFKRFGGVHGLARWYRDRLNENLAKVFRLCVECERHFKETADERLYFDGSTVKAFLSSSATMFSGEVVTTMKAAAPASVSCGKKVCIRHFPETIDESRHPVVFLGKYDKASNRWLCPVSGKPANMTFEFEFRNFRQVEKFLGRALPKFCAGWTKDVPYGGNSILDVCDPVGRLKSPLGDMTRFMEEAFDFTFIIALSKCGLKKIEKEMKEGSRHD